MGFGGTRFSRKDVPVEQELAASVGDLLRSTPGISRDDIDAVLVATNDNAVYLSAILAELAGISPRIAHTVENLCSSGTNAIVSGAAYVASGLAETVLVAGADRFDSPGQVLSWDRSRGEFGRPVFWASMFASAYKREFGVSDEDLACVPVKNRRNAADNPRAYPDAEVTIQDVLDSRELTGDLRLYECSRPCTGACAVLLASESAARGLAETPVWIRGIGQKTTSASFAGSRDLTRMESTALAARDALSMAGTDPGGIDVTEVHDAFGVCEPLALEDLGFADKGSGARLSKDLLETGDRSVNPRGGLIGAGHPLGATGVAQTAEIVSQLQGRSGRRQVQGARRGLVHNMSAAATSSTVLVMGS